MSSRLKVAYISPLPPTPSGISDYSELLVPFLSEYVDVTLFYDGEEPSSAPLREQFRIFPVQELYNQHLRDDLRLYQIGNSPAHRNMFSVFRILPGVVVLHEPFLHHGLYWSSPLHYYFREVFYELGTSDRESLKCMEQALLQDDRQRLLSLPLIGRILDTSLGIIVHSQTARRIVETQIAKSRLSNSPKLLVVAQPMTEISYDVEESRAHMALPSDALVFGVAGIIHPVKEPSLILQAFAHLAPELQQDSLLLFVGEILRETGDLERLIRRLGIANRVIILGRVDPLEHLHQAMGACDVILGLRQTTIGETSAVTLRAMALGKPVIVRDIGWFSELPDDACVKISPNAGVEELVAAMRSLALSPEKRRLIGEAARRYIQQECDPRSVARQYAEFLWEVYQGLVKRGRGGV